MFRIFALVCSLFLLIFSPLVLAHKVIFDAWSSSGVIEGELGFSNGDMAVNAEVLVQDGSGTLLAAVKTDNDGFFVYTPTVAVDLYLRADLGAGHVGELTLLAADFAADAGLQLTSQDSVTATAREPVVSVGATSGADQQVLLAQLAKLSADVRQLRKEIRVYKEKNDLQSVLGGIGFILGLSGVGFYFAARRKLEQSS